MRKRLRRPYVKAERDQDPNRQIQNQSRMRPRKRGKFCKNAPDFIAITRVQASSNRSISGEMPVRDPPAQIRGALTGARGGGGGGGVSGVGGGVDDTVEITANQEKVNHVNKQAEKIAHGKEHIKKMWIILDVYVQIHRVKIIPGIREPFAHFPFFKDHHF